MTLAILYQTVVGQRLGEKIRVIGVDLERCKEINPLIIDEIPNKQFVPDGYETHPILPSYTWDGNQRFLFNTFKRNVGYGELHLYDMSTASALKLNSLDGVCYYRDAIFSPDGTHIMFEFQNASVGSGNETKPYFTPFDMIGTTATFTPIKLPILFFQDPRENILLSLRPSVP